MEVFQHPKLRLRLSTLAADPDTAAVRQLDHIAQKAVVIRALFNTAHKAPVNLDLIDLHLLQPVQAGISCSKVIHGDLDALILPSAEDAVEMGIVQKLHALRDLNGQRAARQPALAQKLQHILLDGCVPELAVRHIHTHMELRQHAAPPAALLQRPLHDPKAHGVDQSGLLQHGYKFRRRDLSPQRRRIPQKCLRTVNMVGLGADLHLIAHRKPGKVMGHTPLQVLPQLHGLELLLVVLRRKKAQPVFSVGLCRFQRALRVLQQCISVRYMIIHKGNAAP